MFILFEIHWDPCPRIFDTYYSIYRHCVNTKKVLLQNSSHTVQKSSSRWFVWSPPFEKSRLTIPSRDFPPYFSPPSVFDKCLAHVSVIFSKLHRSCPFFYTKTPTVQKLGGEESELGTGTIHLRRQRIFTIFSPTPLRQQFFTTIRRQIWPTLKNANVLNGWSQTWIETRER